MICRILVACASLLLLPSLAEDGDPDNTLLSVSKTAYDEGEDIVVSFDWQTFKNAPWVSLWPADSDPSSLPSPSPYWVYLCSGSQDTTCGDGPASGAVTLGKDSAGAWGWPLGCGVWRAFLIPSDEYNPYYESVASSESFIVGGKASCEEQRCNADDELKVDNSHLPPENGAVINKIAFSACFSPETQHGPDLWQHVRENYATESVWNWLGDNMYADTNDVQVKRKAYEEARNDMLYSKFGPVAEPKIPTTGTWDDHDYAVNNYGDNYECRRSSQNAFVEHFNIPSTDPRHPGYDGEQRAGVYSSYMFSTSGDRNGIHLINLDARYHRSPTFRRYGNCDVGSSTMLGSEQWAWLEKELGRPSEIKVVGSGIQVLPPTSRDRDVEDYCAYDGEGNTFDAANLEIGEGPKKAEGTVYESWAEIPQERTRLLKMVQESINAGNAKHIIFISGDTHWAEAHVKEIPAREGQDAVTVYEVTASGIDQDWPGDEKNSNRLRPDDVDTSDEGGENGIESISFSSENICSGDAMYICEATANYGAIEVDWETRKVHLLVLTPFETTKEAVRITLKLPLMQTLEPSEHPSTRPTMDPTNLHSQRPTELPSQPLMPPSKQPSQAPATRTPTRQPSAQPTTDRPSSNKPSLEPSQVHSEEPSIATSAYLSSAPSVEPQKLPSESATVRPSIDSDEMNIFNPGLGASVQSIEPTGEPSDQFKTYAPEPPADTTNLFSPGSGTSLTTQSLAPSSEQSDQLTTYAPQLTRLDTESPTETFVFATHNTSGESEAKSKPHSNMPGSNVSISASSYYVRYPLVVLLIGHIMQ